jgi:Ni/Co efflux regulator RcnB
MKKIMSLVIAATFLVAPLAQANAQGRAPDHRRPDGPTRLAPPPKPHMGQKKFVQPRFERGQRVSAQNRRQFVDQRDVRRYRLPEARRGERWVRVNDQFLLINAVNGLIKALAPVRGR